LSPFLHSRVKYNSTERKMTLFIKRGPRRVRCRRCGYSWKPQVPDGVLVPPVPKACPNCLITELWLTVYGGIVPYEIYIKNSGERNG
jgi:hypothetical protein